ncbi:deoxyribonuclease-1 [Ctenopharyngodon idella]|uniref:deoxyribonuclease-1 n=1 Tax=Ctenopharyngodon idella TaxID=7959 RepID=UPI0022316D74|nr:deoxyribonuclease-1 [Ctenopharyngodon idella]
MKIITTLSVLLVSVHIGNSFLIGAFNIKSFGDTKASNATLLNIITKVVHRYDIVLIQEVRDSDLSATKKLMESVNGGSSPYEYQYIVSEPLGRSTYKERYLFIYRRQSVSVSNSFQYDDGCESCGTDTFNREPFVVRFSANTAVRDFALIPQHTSPEVAVQEIDALHDVVLDTRQRWNTNNIMLLGDFNAGCSYVSNSNWSKIRLRTDQSYTWLIPDSADTTVTNTHCPYDRIVVTSDMMKGVSPGSAQVFDFMEAHGLSQSWGLAVSDHFPVEVKLM